MNRSIYRPLLIAVALSLLPLSLAFAQGRGDWPATGGDAAQNRWQRAERALTPESVPSQFKFLWKIQLGTPASAGTNFAEPLLASRLINAQGFKDFVYWPSSDTLYAVDSELGQLLWKKHFDTPTSSSSLCGGLKLSIVLDPPLVINFNARRAPHTPHPQEVPTAAGERRLGVPAGGGGFGLKGIYVLTGDGMLHEQVLTTGVDYAPSVKFLPASNGALSGLSMIGKTIYTATDRSCPGISNGLWAMDVSASAYPVASLSTGSVSPLVLSGPSIAEGDVAYLVMGGGHSDPGQSHYANSVVAVDKQMKAKDWFTPAKPMANFEAVTPVVFEAKGKQYVIAPGSGGSFVLLDAASLGGADHHTPLFETGSFSPGVQKHSWDGYATWTNPAGATFVFASVSAPVSTKEKSAFSSGPTPHGAIIAFRIDQADQKPVLTPIWISHDMLNPAPPTVANGIVVALAGGGPSVDATLLVLDAMTGKQLFSSANTIPTYTHLAGVAIGDGHAFFVDHNGMLYSFGIGMEH